MACMTECASPRIGTLRRSALGHASHQPPDGTLRVSRRTDCLSREALLRTELEDTLRAAPQISRIQCEGSLRRGIAALAWIFHERYRMNSALMLILYRERGL